jgi:hypothetical protein
VPFSERYAAQISAHNTERVAAEDALLADAMPEPSNADLWKEVTVAATQAPTPTVAMATSTVTLAAEAAETEAPSGPIKMVITEEGDSDDDEQASAPAAPVAAAAASPVSEPARKSKFMSMLSEASKEVAEERVDIKVGSLNMEELD